MCALIGGSWVSFWRDVSVLRLRTQLGQFGAGGASRRRGDSVSDEVLDRRPGPIWRHVEPVRKGFSPRWRAEWLTPVVSHLYRLSVSKFCDGDVAIRPPIAVIGAPLDHHRVAARVSPADSEPQPDEVGLHLSDSLAAAYRFTALGPLPHRIFCQGTPSTRARRVSWAASAIVRLRTGSLIACSLASDRYASPGRPLRQLFVEGHCSFCIASAYEV
jgi:hypothetical protein